MRRHTQSSDGRAQRLPKPASRDPHTAAYPPGPPNRLSSKETAPPAIPGGAALYGVRQLRLKKAGAVAVEHMAREVEGTAARLDARQWGRMLAVRPLPAVPRALLGAVLAGTTAEIAARKRDQGNDRDRGCGRDTDRARYGRCNRRKLGRVSATAAPAAIRTHPNGGT